MTARWYLTRQLPVAVHVIRVESLVECVSVRDFLRLRSHLSPSLSVRSPVFFPFGAAIGASRSARWGGPVTGQVVV